MDSLAEGGPMMSSKQARRQSGGVGASRVVGVNE
jgi:hypothetical protein